MGTLAPIHWLIIGAVVLTIFLAVLSGVVVLFVKLAHQRPIGPNLFPCPDCKRWVSRLAIQCPHCGRPLTTRP
jgi:hypothetical protein